MVAVDLGGGSANSPGLAKRHPKAVMALAILILFTILSYADRMIIALLVDPIKADLGLDDVQFSYLTGLAFALCFGLASLPLAWVADKWSRRWVIYLGVTVWSLATAAGGLAGSFGEMFLSRFFVGVGEAALAPAAFAMIPDLFPKNQVARATGLMGSAAALGGGMAVLSGGFLVDFTETMGSATLPVVGAVAPWQMVFLILGLPGVLFAFLTLLLPGRAEAEALRTAGRKQADADLVSAFPEQADPAAAASAKAGYLRWLTDNWLFMAGLALACSAMGTLAYGLTSWTPAYLSRVFGLSMGEVGLTLGFVQMLSGLVGYIGGGWLIDWLENRGIRNAPHRYLIGTTCVAIVASVGGFYFAGSVGVALFFIGIYHMAAPFASPMVVALQKSVPSDYRGQAIALATMTATLIGLLAGPTVIALFTEKFFGDPASVGASVAIVGVIAGVLGLLFLFASYKPALRARATLEALEG